jgi:hypothetical protein
MQIPTNLTTNIHTHSKLASPLSLLKLPRKKMSPSANLADAAMKTFDAYEGKGQTMVYEKLAGSVLNLPSYFGEELRAHVGRTSGGTGRPAIIRYVTEQVVEDEHLQNIFMVSHIYVVSATSTFNRMSIPNTQNSNIHSYFARTTRVQARSFPEQTWLVLRINLSANARTWDS